MVGGEDSSNGDNAEDGARKIRVGKTVFNIDAEGQVSTRECGNLGHIEECTLRGEALAALIEVLEAVQADTERRGKK